MKFTTLVSLASYVAVATAHMGMTFGGQTAREKAVNGDNYRSPHGSKICQGTPNPGVASKTVKVGTAVSSKTTGGAAHGGGQCSMLVSVDEKTWYKINDVKDCTTTGKHPFTMPAGVPKACDSAKGCTFGWLWTPMLSGTCEIYMNCFNWRVDGALGGIEAIANRKVTMPIQKCIRPNTQSKMSSMFGNIFMGSVQADLTGPVAVPVVVEPITAAPPVVVIPDASVGGSKKCKAGYTLFSTGLSSYKQSEAQTDCATPPCAVYGAAFADTPKGMYKVSAGKTLSKIAHEFDLQCDTEINKDCDDWDQLLEFNVCTAGKTAGTDCIGDADVINVNQVINLPSTECQSDKSSESEPKGIFFNGKWYCNSGYTGNTCSTKIDGANADAGSAATLALVVGAIVVAAL